MYWAKQVAQDKAVFEWQYVDQHVRVIRNSLRKVFLAMEIGCEPTYPHVQQQILTTREELTQRQRIDTCDRAIIAGKDAPYLETNGQVHTERFEYYLYQRIVKLIENNAIFVTESAENKRLEDDLIPKTEWDQRQTALKAQSGQAIFTRPVEETLSEKHDELTSLMAQVASRIHAGSNSFVVPGQRKPEDFIWHLANRRWKDDLENPVYAQLDHMSIIDIMLFVQQQTGFLDAFKPAVTRKQNIQASEADLIACLLANGTNYGTYQMARISDRSHNTLRQVDQRFIRLENTTVAGECLANAIAKLPVYAHYIIYAQAPFASVDGQKHGCRLRSFKTRFSAKYFRQARGVSALTLVCNHVPLATQVIPPNEYEGHYAFDLLFNNASDIQPGCLATDTHGVNSVNFALLDAFGYQFTPRYKNFRQAFEDQFEWVHGPQLGLRLREPINQALIRSEWDNICRILVSLSRKTVSQSTIVKKIGNGKQSSRTLAALQEYDRLVKAKYLLSYMDDETLRHYVQQALNRGEAYHQLRRAIASINGNQFRGGNDADIEKWNDCARLVALCIVYYNAALISGLLDKFVGNEPVTDMLKQLSPVAWRHIQLAGHYTFGDDRVRIDVTRLLAQVDPLSEDAVSLVAA